MIETLQWPPMEKSDVVLHKSNENYIKLMKINPNW